MQHNEIRNITLEILQEAKDGRFISAYQIFERIKAKDPKLAMKIEATYSPEKGEPPTIAGSDEHFTIAVFIANALTDFQKSHEEIKQEWLEAMDIMIGGIQPSGPKITIWAWK
ncbi:MAG: hypothetical protein ABSB79_11345 [Syntrophales bacterium]|jgi:hypothetical protein